MTRRVDELWSTVFGCGRGWWLDCYEAAHNMVRDGIYAQLLQEAPRRNPHEFECILYIVYVIFYFFYSVRYTHIIYILGGMLISTVLVVYLFHISNSDHNIFISSD